jgi:hypothetical protein
MILGLCRWLFDTLARTAADPRPHQHGPVHRFTAPAPGNSGDAPKLRLVVTDDPADPLENLPPGEQMALLIDEVCLLTATCLDIRDTLHELVKVPNTEGNNTDDNGN